MSDSAIPPDRVHAIVFNDVPGPALTNVEFVEFMGSRFIKGRSVGPSDDHWVHNRIGHVALDKIRSIVIFDNVAQYRNALLSAAKDGQRQNHRTNDPSDWLTICFGLPSFIY